MDDKQRVIDALNKFKQQVALVRQSSPAGLLTKSDLKTLTKRGISAGLSQAEIDLVFAFTAQSKKKLMR